MNTTAQYLGTENNLNKIPSLPIDSEIHNTSKQLDTEQVRKAFLEASSFIAPVWDASSSVAVNPMHGMVDRDFLSAIRLMESATGANLVPSLEYYRRLYSEGKIADSDIDSAINQNLLQDEDIHLGSQLYSKLFKEKIIRSLILNPVQKRPLFKCYSDLFDTKHNSKSTTLITKKLSQFVSAYYNEGSSIWKLPKKDEGLLYALIELIEHDRGFEGYHQILKLIKHLRAIEKKENLLFELSKNVLEHENLSFTGYRNYLFRLLSTVKGWAAYIQRHDFEKARAGHSPIRSEIEDLLILRLLYDLAYQLNSDNQLTPHLEDAPTEPFDDLSIRYALLLASEKRYRDQVIQSLGKSTQKELRNKDVQMVFCIDVRSEAFRRNLEKNAQNVQTLGFAGFFGIPFNLKLNDLNMQQCPVLLEPQFTVEAKELHHPFSKALANETKRIQKNGFLFGASSFSMIESFGLFFGIKSVLASLGVKTINNPSPIEQLSQTTLTFHEDEIDLAGKVEVAANVLKNMGIINNIAPLVVLVGHESTSTNNPYASALDCGACAGHSGLMNARYLASLLNEPEIRKGLQNSKGIVVPEETYFIAAIHNTTLDQVTFSESPNLDNKQLERLNQLKDCLLNAQADTQKEREVFFDLQDNEKSPKAFLRRARDWSEIRPEWGLARNASFIVGPRTLTHGINLDSRSFLHDYITENDPDGSVLELIMTAPMVVTNWINMQYYASSVDPVEFGSGNKTLHNPISGVGCVSGNQSDLLIGLSEQSLRVRGEYFHEPLRLQVFIRAEASKIQKIIEKHKLVAHLTEHNWINVISIDPNGKDWKLFDKNGWTNL